MKLPGKLYADEIPSRKNKFSSLLSHKVLAGATDKNVNICKKTIFLGQSIVFVHQNLSSQICLSLLKVTSANSPQCGPVWRNMPS